MQTRFLSAVTALTAVLLIGCGSGGDSAPETAASSSTVSQAASAMSSSSAALSASSAPASASSADASYPLVDSAQARCFDTPGQEITCPEVGSPDYGQDAQFVTHAPAYTDNGDGTVSDEVTGIMWQRSPDANGDGTIDINDKQTYDQALQYCSDLDLAGHDDWVLPTIKQLYALIDFRGIDPGGALSDDVTGLRPFIDTEVFDFAYGDTAAGDRIIDVQYVSQTLYVAQTTGDGGRTAFGVNFADGRIKGYGLTAIDGQAKTFHVICARDVGGYGTNRLVDNGDGTVTDRATGLMWEKKDSQAGMDWGNALALASQKNGAGHLGYNDWRVPDAKELQSIVDYTRAPEATDSAAIDPLFEVTTITNEAGEPDYPTYWTNTTHIVSVTQGPGMNAVYFAFGRAMGKMDDVWGDIHGAGAQRSDPKVGSAADFPDGRGPQGDAVRIENYVRLVRTVQ